MLKQFLKDSVIYGFGKFITSAISFFLVPVYTRVFSPADYGTIDILNAISTLILMTVALEVSQGVIRFIIDAPTQEERINYSSTALWFSVVVYTLFVTGTIIFASPLSILLLGQGGQETAFQWAMVAIWGTGVFRLAQNQLRYQMKSGKYTFVSVLDTVLSLILSVVLVVTFKMGIVGVFVGGLLASLISTVLGFYWAREDYGWRFNWHKLGEMLRFSLPLVPSGIGVFVYLYIDRLTITRLMTMTDVGLFGVGYRIASMVSLLMFGFQTALTPLIYNHYREPNTPNQLARLFRYFSAAALLVTIGLSLYSREILAILTTEQYASAWAVVPLLVPASIFSTLYIFAPGLAIAKKTSAIALINIAGATINTILNFLFIPVWGIEGAALATLTSTIIVFGCYMFFSQRSYSVPHSWGRLVAAGVITIGIVAAGNQMAESTVLNLVVKAALIVVAGGIYLVLGLVTPAEFKRILLIVRSETLKLMRRLSKQPPVQPM
jgi:O-antigen/teichoic acid export membrane protein